MKSSLGLHNLTPNTLLHSRSHLVSGPVLAMFLKLKIINTAVQI